MKKSKSNSSAGEPSNIIQLGIVFIIVAGIVLLSVAFKLYTY